MYNPNRKKCYCAFCHREIKWIRQKKSGRSIPVEPDAVCFVPDDSSQQTFVDQNGDMRRGRSHPDGLRGYRRHRCSQYPVPAHTEEYLKARQWA